MEQNGQITVSMSEILYCLFFGSLLFAKGVGLYDGQAVFKLVLVFAAACLLLKIVTEKYTAAELLKMFAIIALTAVTYLISGEKGMLLYGAMMIGMKYVDVRRVFNAGLLLWGAAFLSITVTSLFHMEDTVYVVHDKLGMGHIFRWSLGYPHPNVLQVSYFILAVFVIYLLGDGFRPKHALYLFAGNCLVFLYSVSYTGFAVIMCLLAGRLYLYFRKKLCFAEKILLQLIFPLCVFVSLAAPVTFKGKLFALLNQALNTRMELAYRYLKPEFISLFGVRLSDITTEVLTMDNAYLFAFITYGIIPFALLCLITIWALYKFLKNDNNLEALILLSITVGGLTEPFLYNTSFKNLGFVLIGALLFQNSREDGARYLFSIKGLQSMGRQFTLNTVRWSEAINHLKRMMAFDRYKCLAGVAAAVLVCGVIYLTVSYPPGYVVDRDNCANLTKERHYYEKGNPEYEDFREMGEFEEGREIEYFSGNIVLMEKLRNIVAGAVLGYTAGYAIAGIAAAGRRNRQDRGLQ